MKHCLIVDDSRVIRKVSRHIVESFEFEVSETENDVAHIREAIEAGADDYVMKPFDHDTLQKKLQLIGAA